MTVSYIKSSKMKINPLAFFRTCFMQVQFQWEWYIMCTSIWGRVHHPWSDQALCELNFRCVWPNSKRMVSDFSSISESNAEFLWVCSSQQKSILGSNAELGKRSTLLNTVQSLRLALNGRWITFLEWIPLRV